MATPLGPSFSQIETTAAARSPPPGTTVRPSSRSGSNDASLGSSLRLPTGVIHSVLSHLEARDLSTSAQVCCELYECCDHPALWEAAGQVTYPHAEKLGALQLYNGEWKTLLRDQNRRDRSTLFEWEVTDCLTNTARRFSPTFLLGDYTFQLIVDPNGNPYVPLAKPGVSVYLTCCPTHANGLPPIDTWECCVAFALAVVNQTGARQHANGYLSEKGSIKVQAHLRLACLSLKLFTSDAMKGYRGFGLAEFSNAALTARGGKVRSCLSPPPPPPPLVPAEQPQVAFTAAVDIEGLGDGEGGLGGVIMEMEEGMEEEGEEKEEEDEDEEGREEAKEEGEEDELDLNPLPLLPPPPPLLSAVANPSSSPASWTCAPTTAVAPPTKDTDSSNPSLSSSLAPTHPPPFRVYEVFQCMTVAAFRRLLARDLLPPSLTFSSSSSLRLWTVTQPWADLPAAPRELVRSLPPSDHPSLPEDLDWAEASIETLEEHQTLAMALDAHVDSVGEARVWVEIAGDGGLKSATGGGKARAGLVRVGKEEALEVTPPGLRMLPDPLEPAGHTEWRELAAAAPPPPPPVVEAAEVVAAPVGGMHEGGGQQQQQEEPVMQHEQQPLLPMMMDEVDEEDDDVEDGEDDLLGDDQDHAPPPSPSPPPPPLGADSAVDVALQQVEEQEQEQEPPYSILLFLKCLVPSGHDTNTTTTTTHGTTTTTITLDGSSSSSSSESSIEFWAHALLPITTPIKFLLDYMSKEALPEEEGGREGGGKGLRIVVETPPTNWQSPALSDGEGNGGRGVERVGGGSTAALDRQDCQKHEEYERGGSHFRCLDYHPTKTLKDLRLENGQILCFFLVGQEGEVQRAYQNLAHALLTEAASVVDWTGPTAKVEERRCPLSIMLQQPRPSSLPVSLSADASLCVRPRGSRLRPRLLLDTVADLFEKLGTQRFRVRNTFFEHAHTNARETLEYSLGRHLGFCCDRCGCLDFKGPRFKCCICQDYDLCQACRQLPVETHRYRFQGRAWAKEEYQGHREGHAMVCLQPIPATVAMLKSFRVREEEERKEERKVGEDGGEMMD
ncbi:hypothetical protein VYU27_005005 [Nannochloropsis oceanica]